MAYIDKAFYDSMSSIAISEEEFAPMAERASDIIDAATFRAVERCGIAEGDALYAMVMKATVYQMEFIQRTYGSLDAWESDYDEVDSETIGNYSYSKSSTGKQRVNGLVLSPHAKYALGPVIALGRRVGR